MENHLVSLSDQLAASVERASASVVAVHARPYIGMSGIVWRENIVLTSSEGIRSEENIKVILPDGRAVEGKLRGRDKGTDLALVEAETGGVAPVEVAPDAELKAGQFVLAVGRTANTGPIASLGIISGVSGEWKSWRGGSLKPFVRLDISAYPTSSGGAAVNAAGAIIGLVSTGLSRSSVLAVTRTTIERVAPVLLEKGYVSRGFLGVALQPVVVPGDLKEKFHIEQNTGIMLVGVEPNGPGASGGLIIGDVLLAGNGSALTDPETLANVLFRTASGEALTFRVLRGGTIQEVTVHVGERPGRGR
jgi:S1-C subfamily serine protease